MSRQGRSNKSRPQLDAKGIAAAALALVDKQGMEGLSFRNIAKVMRCEAMSLYHYFPSKAHLLDAMVSICLGEMKDPLPELPWWDRLKFGLHEYRAMALRHPGFFQFISVYRMNSREGLGFLNKIILILEDSGLPAEKRAIQFRILGYFLNGACLDEALGYAKGPSAAKPVPPEEARKSFPAIMKIGPYFSKDYHRQIFDQGLQIILDNMKREAALRMPQL